MKIKDLPKINRPGFDVEKILTQLKRWQEKLLDVSKSNPLLGLNRARTAKLKTKDPDAFVLFQKLVTDENELHLPFVRKVKGKKSGDLFNQEEAVEEKEIYKIEEGDIEFDVNSPADLRRKLRRIYDNARTTIEERGVVTLYVTFGAVRWHDDVLGDSISPILLVPCELVSKGPNAALRLKIADEEIQVNPAITYYFREKHKINLPELPVELDHALLKIFLKKVEKCVSEQEWQVIEEVWFGTFSFESLVLYQDLKLLAEQACSNPLIAAFAHASRESGEDSEALGDDLDSLETPKIVPVPVLPVDSSQLKALTYTAAGENVVIHGPPGTGKSQTISNIIADALGKNKKVLFVSAKMAALNVVFDRLKKEGLGQFCLEAHGIKAGKLKIIEELKRTLESEDSNNTAPLEQELESLQNTRKQLNKYVATLHTVVAPLGLSVFQAMGKYAKLQKISDVKGVLPWTNILEVSRNELTSCIDALDNVAQMTELFDAQKKHPWRGFNFLDYSLQLQEKIETDIKFLSQSFVDLIEILSRLRKLLPQQNFAFEELRVLTPVLDAISRIEKLPENWQAVEVPSIEEKRDLFKEASSLSKEFNDKNLRYQEFSNLAFKETVDLLSEVNSTFQSWTNRFTFSYFKWQRKIKSKLKPKIKVGYKNIQNYYDEVI